jgi:hypothetical protein
MALVAAEGMSFSAWIANRATNSATKIRCTTARASRLTSPDERLDAEGE